MEIQTPNQSIQLGQDILITPTLEIAQTEATGPIQFGLTRPNQCDGLQNTKIIDTGLAEGLDLFGLETELNEGDTNTGLAEGLQGKILAYDP